MEDAIDDGPIAVVDGGGTGTRARILAPCGAVLGEGHAGPSSLALGLDQAWRNTALALREAAAAGGLADPGSLGLRLWGGYAGGGTRERRAVFVDADPLGCRAIVIASDGLASLVGAHAGRPGTVLAVGTGVAALSLDAAGQVRWSGGWGFPIGDEGGGAWIGHRALALLTRRIDGRRSDDGPLIASLMARAGADYDSLQSWLLGADATDFAALAPLVVDAAAAGDTAANGILADAAVELDRAVTAIGETGPLALLGGLAATFASRLAPPHKARLVPPQGSALDGLAYLAACGWTGDAIRAGADERRHP